MTRTAPSVEIEIPADRTDLSTWTPQQVDTVLAEIYGRVAEKRFEQARQRRYMADTERRMDPGYWLYKEYEQADLQRQVAKYEAKIAAIDVEIREISKEAVPFNAEYQRRP